MSRNLSNIIRLVSRADRVSCLSLIDGEVAPVVKKYHAEKLYRYGDGAQKSDAKERGYGYRSDDYGYCSYDSGYNYGYGYRLPGPTGTTTATATGGKKLS